MKEHAPGPWMILDCRQARTPQERLTIFSAPRGAHSSVICRIENTVKMGPITEEDEANAHLIVVAPKLLASLKECAEVHGAAHEDWCPKDDTCDCKWKSFNDRVNAAIREAEEGTS